jgi:alginate O-acetyltransferase complex protein AlgJ
METRTGRGQGRRRLTRLFPEPGRANVEGVADDPSRGILTTEVSPRLARVMTIGFVAAIAALPIIQAGVELYRQGRIQALEIFRRLPTHSNLARFEADLTRLSDAARVLRPRLQLDLSGGLGFGTTTVILGRDGWLFYRPGIDWVGGLGLLDPARLRRRRKELAGAGEAVPSPDPRPAIRALQEDCLRAGVHLIVMPVPDKATVQPARLTSRYDRAGLGERPTNLDYGRFVDELRACGVDVFDPTPGPGGDDEPDRFLRQDTHWTPEWMETVARGLAEHIRRRIPTPRDRTRAWRVEAAPASRVGDIVDMLQLPEGQRLYPPETVTIHRVLDSGSGHEWAPRAEADILLLGDSFSNIYGAPDLGWGEAAGLPAQLARFLGRDVDVIARNGSGSTATRRELARRPNPLAGKAVLVWEFAARELMQGNWEIVPMRSERPRAPADRPSRTASSSPSPLVLEGTVLATSHVPRPFEVPYKDCLTYTMLRVDRVVAGTYDGDRLIAVFWGMKDNIRQPAADYREGMRLRLRIVPLRKARLDLQSVRSADDLDDFEHQPNLVLEESAL